MDANVLPPEVLFLIFRYLSEKDVSFCSRVCVRWREETNRNELWKRFSLKNGWVDTNYPDVPGICNHIPSHVEPPFQPPDHNLSARFSPLCSWYINYLQGSHLYQNWKNNKYVIQVCDAPFLGDVTAIDFNKKHLLLACDSGQVLLCKITQKGPKLLEKLCCVFEDAVISHIVLGESAFALMQQGLLQVYKKTGKSVYSLCYIKAMITNNITLPDLINVWPTQRSFDDWFVENLYDNFDDSKFQLTHNAHLVAFWGTRNGVEVLSLNSPENGLDLLHLLPFENYSVIDVALSGFDFMYIVLGFVGMRSIIVEYCFKDNICTNHIQATSSVLQIKVALNFILSIDNSGLFCVWDRKTSAKLNEVQTSIDLSQTLDFQVLGNSVSYWSGNTNGLILDCKTQNEFVKFELKYPAQFLCNGMCNFFLVRRKRNVEVWSKRDTKRLHIIENVLYEGVHYSARCCDSFVVLWGLNLSPIFIWFW